MEVVVVVDGVGCGVRGFESCQKGLQLRRHAFSGPKLNCGHALQAGEAALADLSLNDGERRQAAERCDAMRCSATPPL